MIVRLLFTLLLLIQPPTKNTLIQGSLVITDTTKDYMISGIQILFRSRNEIIGRTSTNHRGAFKYKLLTNKRKEVDVLYLAIGLNNAIYLTTVDINGGHDTINVVANLPVKIKRNLWGKVICPKCEKANETYKVAPGEVPVSPLKRRKSRDTKYSPIANGKYYSGTCGYTNEDPQHYCSRDSIFF